MQTILNLKKSSLEVFSVQHGQKTATAETTWDPDNLVSKLELIKDKFQTSSIRVLLDDDIAYTMNREVKEGEVVTRESVLEEIKKQFPDTLGEDWDFRIADEDGKQTILVFAPVKAIFDVLASSASKAGLVLEDVEPVSFALRRGEDAVLSLAAKSLKGKDEDVLNLRVEIDEKEQKLEDTQTVRKPSKPLSNKVKTLLIAFFVVLVVSALVVGGIIRSKSTKSPEPSPEPSITPVIVSPSPTPEPPDLSTLSVQILNGSGVAGEAGAVKDVLTEEGFDSDNIETGNADNYDYKDTEVSLDSTVNPAVYDIVKKSLNSEYYVVPGEDLESDNEYSVVIIVGTKTEE